MVACCGLLSIGSFRENPLPGLCCQRCRVPTCSTEGVGLACPSEAADGVCAVAAQGALTTAQRGLAVQSHWCSLTAGGEAG